MSDGESGGTGQPSTGNEDPAHGVARVYWVGFWQLFSTVIGGVAVAEVLAHPAGLLWLYPLIGVGCVIGLVLVFWNPLCRFTTRLGAGWAAFRGKPARPGRPAPGESAAGERQRQARAQAALAGLLAGPLLGAAFGVGYGVRSGFAHGTVWGTLAAIGAVLVGGAFALGRSHRAGSGVQLPERRDRRNQPRRQ